MFKKISKKKDDKLSKDFLPEALEIVEKPASPLGYFIIWITILIILAFLIWSIYGRVDVTANARGKVVTTDGVQIVQAINAGVVTEIFAKDGDKVKIGDRLIALNSDLEKESLAYSFKYIELLNFKINLLNKVLKDIDISSYKEETNGLDQQKIIEYIMTLQEGRKATIGLNTLELEKSSKQLKIEKINYDAIVENGKVLKDEKERLEKNYRVVGLERLKSNKLTDTIIVLEKDVKTYEVLYENDAIAKVELDNKQKELEELKEEKIIQQKIEDNESIAREKELIDLMAKINENKKIIESQKAKIELEEKNVELSNEALENATINSNESIAELIVQFNSELKENYLTKKQKQYNYDNQILTAPIAGTIQKIAVNTIGGVVSQAQALVEIIPDQSVLIIEAELPNKDIGYVNINQQASLKLDTYNFQEYGMLSGNIIDISPDAVENEKKELLYKVKIAVDTESFTKKNENSEILTGMECTVEIKIGNRRIISFFLEPLIKNFDESLKVR